MACQAAALIETRCRRSRKWRRWRPADRSRSSRLRCFVHFFEPAPAPQGRKRKRAKAKAQESSDINYRRRRNIAHLVVERHGRLAKADLCIPYAAAAAWHCPAGGERRSLMVQWCQWTCAPPSVERQIDAILAANPPRRISADALARHLAVSDAERTALCIWSIGSYDVPWAARVQRRKEKKALAAKARRQARGAKPREQALSTTKPWLKDGIGERQWRRHRKKATSEFVPSILPSNLATNFLRHHHRMGRPLGRIRKQRLPKQSWPANKPGRLPSRSPHPSGACRGGQATWCTCSPWAPLTEVSCRSSCSL